MTEQLTHSSQTGTRASDAERQGLTALLERHYTAGRLTLDELDERVAVAYAARTREQLAALTTDLPADPTIDPEPDPATLALGTADPGLHCLLLWACPPVGLAYWLLTARRGRSRPRPLAVSAISR
jgi:hypothetical protein